MRSFRKFAGKYSIKTYGQGKIIGLEDVVNQRSYTMTLKCVSDSGKLLKVPSQLLMRYLLADRDLFMKFWDETKNLDRNTSQVILDSIQSQIDLSQVSVIEECESPNVAP